ncbi:hypothetical protein [Baia soyae]|uniref:Asparagine synthase n=1 Tax=Baia soyae TaxID=1544746 RepID=A0A4R2RSM5_9BACL|nr:hypothetical protein [Baia soyae]TCP65547.1 hypothetical protein EDD57_13229 [Baia soyae]
MECITDPTVHYNDHDAECYFIGEMLSNEEESYRAFRHFVSHRSPRFILSLRGNYQSIIRISNQLWMFADLGSVRPIYYAKQKAQLLFSSHLSIIHQKINSELHTPWLRRYLLTGGTHIELEAPFKAIHMISGGFGLHFKGDHVHTFQAWDVDEESLLSWEMAQDQLKKELTQSVLLRCKNKYITSDLSGGLDSSTLGSWAL